MSWPVATTGARRWLCRARSRRSRGLARRLRFSQIGVHPAIRVRAACGPSPSSRRPGIVVPRVECRWSGGERQQVLPITATRIRPGLMKMASVIQPARFCAGRPDNAHGDKCGPILLTSLGGFVGVARTLGPKIAGNSIVAGGVRTVRFRHDIPLSAFLSRFH